MTDNEQKESFLELYVLDTMHEHTIFDRIRRLAVDKTTFEKYFPNWKHKGNSKPKLQPKRKKA